MHLTLMRDRIAVLPDRLRDDVTAAGIVVQARHGIHTSAEQLGRTGTVVAVGPEIDTGQLKVGDRIMFGEFEYPEHTNDRIKYLIMQDKDVCGVVE